MFEHRVGGAQRARAGHHLIAPAPLPQFLRNRRHRPSRTRTSRRCCRSVGRVTRRGRWPPRPRPAGSPNPPSPGASARNRPASAAGSGRSARARPAPMPTIGAATALPNIALQGMRNSGPVLMARPGQFCVMRSIHAMTRCPGTNASSTMMSLLPVPRNPITSHTSSTR